MPQGRAGDRVMETSTSTGATDFTLDGAVAGYITFNTAFSTNRSVRYCIEAVDGNGVPTGEWEVGTSYLNSSTVLERNSTETIVEANSSGTTALISFAAGTKNVFNPFSGLAARKSTHGFDLQYGMP